MKNIIFFVFILLAVPAYADDVVMKLNGLTNSSEKTQAEYVFYTNGQKIATEIYDVKQEKFLPATGTIPDGIVKLIEPKSDLRMEYTYKNNLPDGEANIYTKTGAKVTVQNWGNGVLLGWKNFNADGTIKEEYAVEGKKLEKIK